MDYPDWYWIPQIKFKIRNYTYRRETAFIAMNNVNSGSSRYGRTVRMIKIHNVQHFDIWLKNMHISDDKKNFNLYYSLARYKNGIPNGSLNLSERDFGNWNLDHWKEMEAYDFLLDIDAGNHEQMDFAYLSTDQIRLFFDKLNVPYYLRFSGMGFHFIIPYECFTKTKLLLSFNPENENNIYNLYNQIAIKLHDIYSEMVDTGIYDSRRVTKIPYSLALYSNKNYLCYPFESDDEFMDFQLYQMLPNSKYLQIQNKNPEKLFNLNGNIFKLLKELKIEM